MLNPASCVQKAMLDFQSLPPEGVAEVAIEALFNAGYVIVPKDFLIELLTTNAEIATEAWA